MLRLGSLVLCLAVGVAAPELLHDADAQEHFAAAQQAFAEENFDAAAHHIEQAYLIEPESALLYPWAQAERAAGRCGAAIELYEQFIASGPPRAELIDYAEQNIARCQDELAAKPAQPEPSPEPAPAPVTEAPRDDEQPLARSSTATDEPPARAKRWYADPLGGALSGVGLAGVVTGAVLLGVGRGAASSAHDAPSYDDYLSERDRATRLRNAGAVVISLGGAALIGGVVRYVTLAAKNKRARATPSAWLTPRSAGLVWSGSF